LSLISYSNWRPADSVFWSSPGSAGAPCNYRHRARRPFRVRSRFTTSGPTFTCSPDSGRRTVQQRSLHPWHL